MREIITRLLLLLGSTAVGLLLVEGAVSVSTQEVEYAEGLPYHPVFGNTMRPGQRLEAQDDTEAVYQYRTNSLGFRGPEWLPRWPEVPRLVVLGDSFVNGWGVAESETLFGGAAARLGAHTGRPWEGIGLGADDWGTAQEFLALQAYGSRLHPEVIVLAFTIDNDVVNNAPGLYERTIVSALDLTRPYLAPRGGQLVAWTPQPAASALRRSSRLFRALERLSLRWWPPGYQQAEWDAAVQGRMPPFKHQELFQQQPGPAWEEAWAITERVILAVREESRRLGARFVVVAIPALQQVQYDFHTARFERTFQLRTGSGAATDAHLEWNAPNQRLAVLSAREHIEFLDLLPPLRRAVRERGHTLYRHDGHFTAEGYRLAGQLLGDFLAGEVTAQTDLLGEPAPIDLLARQGAVLDVRGGPPVSFPGPGWGAWSEGRLSFEGGAEVVLRHPGAGSRLRVEGEVAAGTALPVLLTVAVDAAPVGQILLDRPGPFTLEPQGELTPAPGRCVLINFYLGSPAAGHGERFTLRIARVAFLTVVISA